MKRNGDHFGVGVISGSIWGSFQGWGSVRGRDHFGGCTDTSKVVDWNLTFPLLLKRKPKYNIDGKIIKVLIFRSKISLEEKRGLGGGKRVNDHCR